MKRKGKRKHRFLKFFAVYVSVLAVVIVLTWWLLYDFIGDYEESRPANVMDTVVEQLNNNDITAFLDAAKVNANEFESSTDMLASYLLKVSSDGQITYTKKSGEYTENTPVYLLYASNTPVAKITLEASGENRFGFTLWKLGQVYIGSDYGTNKSGDIVITVPKGSKVAVNGVELRDIYITQDDIMFEPCENVGDYVAAPLKTTYTVSGLMMQPVITASYNDVNLEFTSDGGTYTAQYPTDEALLAEMTDAITALNHAYGAYIINKGSLSAVTSNMVGNAKEYMSDIPAVWAFLYGKEYTYEFQNESIDEFFKYSDECFSCHIYYDLYVQWNSGNVTYNTSLTYTYVYSDGRWVVADFSIE